MAAQRRGWEADSLGMCLELARRGVGLTIVPMSSVTLASASGAITWAPMPEQTVTWALLENEARVHSAPVRSGRRILLDLLGAAEPPPRAARRGGRSPASRAGG